MKNCTGILCPMQYGTVDPATCQAVDYCPQATPPKTNADKIRSMTDEELAEWLDRLITHCNDGPCFNCFMQEACLTSVLEWLKKEVEDG